jgi:predicted DNA-binding WGR domain protein
MKKQLKYIDGNSDKFWEIEVTGSQFTVTYGKNGTSGTTQTKTFSTDEECLKVAQKLLAEKIKKGYSETGEVAVDTKVKTAKSINTDELLKEYDKIIQSNNSDLLLPFLKEKSKGNVEVLKKHIKKYRRQWQTGTITIWWKQKDIITLSAIALFDKTDINSWDEVIELLNEIEQKPQVLDVLLWAKPTWLESFILDKSKRESWRIINYPNLRKLEERNLIQFNPELYALSLSEISGYCNRDKGIQKTDVITQLLNDKTAYKRDIPELFNYETDLHYEYFYNKSHNKNFMWITIYKSLLEEKKMDRTFFIENAIQIQTKEWNKELKSFFRKRIEELNLTADELILQQEKIFPLLHYSYPPITSYGMELVKQIYDHPKFKTKSFLEWLEPLMLRSDCKAAIKNVLPILEKLYKVNPKLSAAITSIIANVYVIADLNLQERATKIITKIGNIKDKALKEKLSSYVTLMQGNIKFDLTPFLDQDALIVDDTSFKEYTYNQKKELLLTEEVTLPKDWNAVLFQFGNFISSDETLDTEILLNTYITQRNLFPVDYTAQLQPYAKQLQKKYFGIVHKEYLSDFLLQKIKNINSQIVFNNRANTNINSLKLIQPLIKRVQQKIVSNSTLPLLSFPSHIPYWVAPNVLLERIIAYQKNGEVIDPVDLSIAIARMPRENICEAIPLLDKIEGELKPLLSFCLGLTKKIKLDTGSILLKLLTTREKTNQDDNLSLWAVAVRTFYPSETFAEFENTQIKDIPFVVAPLKPEITFKEQWNEWENYVTKEKERTPSWYELRFDLPSHSKIQDFLLYSLDAFKRSDRYDWDNLTSWEKLFRNLDSRSYILNSEGNTYYWHSLTPQNADALSLTLLQICNNADGDGLKLELKGFLSIINRPEFRFSNISLLVYACCFFQKSKDLRLQASEELINLIEKQAIDVEALAQKLAFLASEKYGVFLRMTDCIIALKDVSSLHNSALLKLLNSLFEHLDVKEKLPANFKKLVENYIDVLIKTNQKPAEKAITFFEQWKDNPSLKSLIKQILK